MKQGQASHSGMGSTKVEPRSHAVSPAAVSQIGLKQGNHATGQPAPVRVTKVPMYEGRGLQAPMVGTTSHKAGSQGHHK